MSVENVMGYSLGGKVKKASFIRLNESSFVKIKIHFFNSVSKKATLLSEQPNA